MLSLLSSLILNISFMVIVIIQKSLRDQMELIICLILTASNICRSVLFSTFYMASLIYGKWPFGKSPCYVVGTIQFFLELLRNTMVLAITVERFGAVMFPFRYPQHRMKVTAVIFTVGGMHSVIMSLLFNSSIFGCYKLLDFDFVCTVHVNCSKKWCYFIHMLLGLIIVITGVGADSVPPQILSPRTQSASGNCPPRT